MDSDPINWYPEPVPMWNLQTPTIFVPPSSTLVNPPLSPPPHSALQSIPTFQPPSVPTCVLDPAAAQICNAFAVFQQGMHEAFNDLWAAFRKTEERLKHSRRLIQDRSHLIQELRTKVPTATTAATTIQYAPEDPTLPSPWRGLIDGSLGSLYYWNPETNQTQYERPCEEAAQHPLRTLTSSDDSVHPNPQPFHHSPRYPLSVPSSATSVPSKPPLIHPTQPIYLHRKQLRVLRRRVSMAATRRLFKANRKPYQLSTVGKGARTQRNCKKGLWAVKAQNGYVFSEIMEEICQPCVGTETPTTSPGTLERSETNPSSSSLISDVLEPIEALHSRSAVSTLVEEIKQRGPALLSPGITSWSGNTHISELKQESGVGDAQTGPRPLVTVAVDFNKCIHSMGDGSCHLRYQYHSSTSVEANIVDEISRVTPAIESEFAIVIAPLKPEAVHTHGSSVDSLIPDEDNPCPGSTMVQQIAMKDEFHNKKFALVYRFCKLGNFDVSTPCFDSVITYKGLLNDGFGEGNFSTGDKFVKLVPAELASEDNAKDVDSIVTEGLKLYNEMVMCAVDAQSEARLLQWLVLCYCVSTKPVHFPKEAFDKIGAMNPTSLSQVWTTLNLNLQGVRRALESLLPSKLKLYCNFLHAKVGKENWPTDAWVEKMKWDANHSLDKGLHGEIRVCNLQVATLLADATGSIVLKLFHISEVVIRRLEARKITASLSLLKFLFLPQVFEMRTTDICYALPCDYHCNYLPLIIGGKEQFRNSIPLSYLLRFGRSYKSDVMLTSTTQCIVPVKHENIFSSTWTNKDQTAGSTFLHQFKKENFAEILILLGYHFQQSIVQSMRAKDVMADFSGKLGCMLFLQPLLKLSDQSDLFYQFPCVQYMLPDCSGTEKYLKSINNGCSYSLSKRDIGMLLSILVARDVATPELDIFLVIHVINYHCLNNIYDDAKKPWYSRLKANWSSHSSGDSPVPFPLSVLEFFKPAVRAGLRYSSGNRTVLMPTVVIQPVVLPLFDAWLLLLHDQLCRSGSNTSLSMSPYFALGTTSRVSTYPSLMLANMLNHEKATLDVIFPTDIFYVDYASTRIEIATSWILLSTPLFYLTVWVLNLHGWMVIKAHLLIEDAFLITEMTFGNELLIILSGVMAIGHVCHIGATLQINSFLHMVLLNMYWLATHVILRETTDTWAYFQVSFYSALAMVWQNANEGFHRVFGYLMLFNCDTPPVMVLVWSRYWRLVYISEWDLLIMDSGATKQSNADKLMARDVQGFILTWSCSAHEKATKSMMFVPRLACIVDGHVGLPFLYKLIGNIAWERALLFHVPTIPLGLSGNASRRPSILTILAKASGFAELVKGLSMHQLYIMKYGNLSTPKPTAQVLLSPTSRAENLKMLHYSIISQRPTYKELLTSVEEEQLVEVMINAMQEPRRISDEVFVCAYLPDFTCSRLEDMPCFKGGGMLGPLCYTYILLWASVLIYLNGLLIGLGSGHIVNGFLGLVVETTI